MRKKMIKDIVVRGVVGVVVGHDGDILLRPSDRERERDRQMDMHMDGRARARAHTSRTDRQAGRETTRDTRVTKYQCSGSHE